MAWRCHVRTPQPAERHDGHARAGRRPGQCHRGRRVRRRGLQELGPDGAGERRALLLKAADALESKAAAFSAAMAAETGATSGWAGFNVQLGAGMLREAAALTTQIGGEVIPSDVPGSLATGLRQPAGVMLGIAPWNVPVILGVRAIATPPACGNTVVLKGSELCPRTPS